MNKIGYIIEGRIADGMAEKAKKKTKSAATQYQMIFNKFEEYATEESKAVSQRVKLLIKNMFTHRSGGW